jgi:uncharacterized RmlC-like cupin family protein
MAGEPVREMSESGAGRPHHTAAGKLGEDTAQTAGMRRFEGISGRLGGAKTIWMGETHVTSGTVSAVHHHGRSETAIFVLEGHPSFVFATAGGEERIETGPGDYVYVPPFVAHREENGTDDEAVVVIARNTEEAIVVNLDGWPGEGEGGGGAT